MKKYLIYCLVISMLFLCSCKTDNISSSEETPLSDISSGQSNVNTQTDKATTDNNSTKSQTEDLQNKTVINVDSQTAKMYFTNSNDNISQYKKEYITAKESKNEQYTKKDMQNISVNVLGTEYKDIPYYQSEKNQYTGSDYDIFKNDETKIYVLPSGDVMYFSTETPKHLVEGVYKHSEEAAKKYLEKISPNYIYDSVRFSEIDFIDWYNYTFFKTINGIRTSDCITITLNSYGALKFYVIKNSGKYDNIEIKNLDVDVFLKRIDNYVNEAYGDKMTEYGIDEEGPYYDIYVGDKLELSYPIWIKVKGSEGNEYTITEVIVFALN